MYENRLKYVLSLQLIYHYHDDDNVIISVVFYHIMIIFFVSSICHHITSASSSYNSRSLNIRFSISKSLLSLPFFISPHVRNILTASGKPRVRASICPLNILDSLMRPNASMITRLREQSKILVSYLDKPHTDTCTQEDHQNNRESVCVWGGGAKPNEVFAQSYNYR